MYVPVYYVTAHVESEVAARGVVDAPHPRHVEPPMTAELAQNICDFMLSTRLPRRRRPLTRGLNLTPTDLCKSEAELTAGWRKENFDPRNWPLPRAVEVAPLVLSVVSDSQFGPWTYTVNTEQVV